MFAIDLRAARTYRDADDLSRRGDQRDTANAPGHPDRGDRHLRDGRVLPPRTTPDARYEGKCPRGVHVEAVRSGRAPACTGPRRVRGHSQALRPR